MSHIIELIPQLLTDLKNIGIPVEEVDLFVRPYSKTFYGRYFPVYDENVIKPKIHLYPFSNNSGSLLSYSTIFSTAVHEFCHHIQFSNKNYQRVRGVMHNPNFWEIYNSFINKAENENIL